MNLPMPTPDLPAPHPVREPLELPAFETLHPNARFGMRIAAMLAVALPVAGPSAALLILWDSAGVGFAAKAAIWLAAVTVALVVGWRLGNARWSRTVFALDDAGLRIRRGLFWRSETLVPRTRVQHTDINRGPLDRKLGLASLKVYTAGTKLASVSLDGLPAERAIELRDALVAAGDDVL